MTRKPANQILLRLGIVAALLAGGSIALQAQQAQQGPPVRQVSQDQHSPEEMQPGEARIAREVRHQLLLLPFYTIFDWFQFQVQGSTVILSGEVVQPVLKSDANNVVKHIEGVQQVINNIKVLPLSDFDNQTRRAEFRAIYGDPNLSDRYGSQALPPIHIIVDNGHVTLKGVVANTFDKNLINTKANTVPNVFSVDNQLQVEEQPHSSK